MEGRPGSGDCHFALGQTVSPQPPLPPFSLLNHQPEGPSEHLSLITLLLRGESQVQVLPGHPAGLKGWESSTGAEVICLDPQLQLSGFESQLCHLLAV